MTSITHFNIDVAVQQAKDGLVATAIEINDNLTGTVSFARKLSDNNYGSSDAFFALQFPIEEGDTHDVIASKANTAYATCKAMVNLQLGLPADDAVAVALIQNAIPGTVEIPGEQIASVTPINTPAQQVAEAVAPSAETVPAQPPYPTDTRNLEPGIAKAYNKANADWAKARYATHPDEFWNNATTKTNPKSPDLKHKATGAAAWLD